MRETFSERVERGRMHAGHLPTERGDRFGAFDLFTNDNVHLHAIVSAGDKRIQWDHVSVSARLRIPTWEEMCWIKSLFFEDDEVVVQYHPAKSQYVNLHPRTLHLWRPHNVVMPTPPSIAVGPKTRSELAKLQAEYPDQFPELEGMHFDEEP